MCQVWLPGGYVPTGEEERKAVRHRIKADIADEWFRGAGIPQERVLMALPPSPTTGVGVVVRPHEVSAEELDDRGAERAGQRRWHHGDVA